MPTGPIPLKQFPGFIATVTELFPTLYQLNAMCTRSGPFILLGVLPAPSSLTSLLFFDVPSTLLPQGLHFTALSI